MTEQVFKQTIEVVSEVTTKNLEDILVTCFEGGSNYWASSGILANQDPDPFVRYLESVKQPVCCIIEDATDRYWVRTQKLAEGIIRRAAERGMTAQQMMDGDWDAIDADCALQYAIFNEVIYG